jgi:hypothetical protein
VPRGQALAAGAGDVDVTRNRLERAREVTSLEQQPERDLGGLVQTGEFAASR